MSMQSFSAVFAATAMLGATLPGYVDSRGSNDPTATPVTPTSAETFAGLKFRGIGPALMSGRIGDLAVDPADRSHYYAAVSSGGVWKTTNAGTTWTPVFDKEGSYSIGCLAMDPGNPHVVWVGTGENNSQRSVSFGDGVYRTRDGGAHWENLGLRDSEHIGKILIDPRDSDTVYVAAQGPLWRAGGDRGLYKTIDGGRSWERILHVSDDTGINEVHLDPRDSDVLYATSYQRRRHVWTLIDGGPESAVYKSIDAGASWRKVTHGLPEVDLGRIGLAVSPVDPDIVYAIVEAAEGQDGFFRSDNRGETWTRQSDYKTTSAQYYNEIVCDPQRPERVYVLDTILHVTEDGGRTFQRVPRDHRHVDDHALWIDPTDTDYLLIGCDGGVYESFDRGVNWRYMPNLPVTQFYRVSVDNSEPFYFVYGGTQDNNTLGGPSRTTSPAGICNEDWFVTVGGDGFKTRIDPQNPNIVYSQWQHGGLIRFDRRSGQRLDIKPRENPGEDPLRWNWDSPLIISPHNPHRLYFGAQRLFRSDDRGDSWTAISEDLTRRIDRDQLEVMGRIQRADAVAKNSHTSFYGNLVALDESPLVEGLIYAGTDDGLVQVTDDGGETWRRIALFPEVPDMAYVSYLSASGHDADTVFAAFDNHKNADFKPYILVSTDRGRNWESISGDLPERNIVYALAEDHVNPHLLFAGTEFGAFFSSDRGKHWIHLTGEIPTIAVRDLELQRRENDLVLGTFGRGIYILDDYTPLRTVDAELLEQESVLFPVRDALRYIPTSRLGGTTGIGSQGASFFAAPNPPFGAVFTYYLKNKIMSRAERRRANEKDHEKAGTTAPYPTMDELHAEDLEEEPKVLLTVRDSVGKVVRRVTGPRDKGLHRVAWDLRRPSTNPTVVKPPAEQSPWWRPPTGPLAPVGSYTVTLARETDGVVIPLAGPVPFNVVPLPSPVPGEADPSGFHAKVARLHRAVQGAIRAGGEAETRLNHLRQALMDTPAADEAMLADIWETQQRLDRLLVRLRGDPSRRKRESPDSLSISERIANVVSNQWQITTGPTQTQRDAYGIAGAEFTEVLAQLRTLIERDIVGLERKLEDAEAPWTPGRVPTWVME